MSLIFGPKKVIRENKGVSSVDFVDAENKGIAKGLPVQLYTNAAGVVQGMLGVVDGTSLPGHWGINVATIASGVSGTAVVQGSVDTAAASGTASELITAISAAGVVTCSTVGSANADIAIGVCVDTDTIIIY